MDYSFFDLATAARGRWRAVGLSRLSSPMFDIRLNLRVGSEGSAEAVGGIR
jgi:hypothetical protein